MNRRTLLITVAVALLLSLSNWLMERAKVPGLTPAAVSEERPDYFLNDFVVVETDERGELSQRVAANHLVHRPDTDQSVVQQPHVEIFRDHKIAWRAEAKEGVLVGQREVQLSGSVVLEQPGTRTTTRLDTEALRIFPQRRYAETEKPVVLRRGKSRIDGTGMKLYGDEERIVLLSQVRGRHEALAY